VNDRNRNVLSDLKLENFKSWKSAELSFGRRITGLFGRNSSGKSSLIRFLLLLKKTVEATDRNVALDLNAPHVELGTMADVIFEHDETLRLDFELGFRLPEPLKIVDISKSRTTLLTQSDELRLVAGVESRDHVPIGEMLEYGLGGAKFRLERKERGSSQFTLTSGGMEGFKFTRTPGRRWSLPNPMKFYRFPDQARTYYQNSGFLADLERAFEERLNRLFYLGPQREYPRRDHRWSGSSPDHVGEMGELAIAAILAAEAQGWTRNLKPKARRKKFPEMIAYWLRRMGLIHDFKVVEIAPGVNRWQARIRVREESCEVLLSDVGFGVSQVLPVITLLHYVPEGSTVMLEQPDLHLHPLAQAELADVIINAAMHRDLQVLFESHSEHFLLRIQRRIAEEEIPADDVKLYFCNVGKGHSSIESLRLDLLGNIENWPDEFMGNAFSELVEAELARTERCSSASA